MIKAVTFFQAQCDICGNLDDGGEYSAWISPENARTVAIQEAEWVEIKVRAPSTTPRGPHVYVVSREGQKPSLERSILICERAGHHGTDWCQACEDDLDESGWAFSFAPNGGEAIVQTCPAGHSNAIDLTSESAVDRSEQ